nr:PfkB family carbohydrate kinase [Stutzerimonas nosocomialis]
MLELHAQHIRMRQYAADKSAALALMADTLVADGLVAPGYLQGLRAREDQGSTYLGQGIAIPHGTPQTRDQVHATGVRLLQFPDGVDWGDGHRVYLAIGIAARSDEHLRLLQLLTRALGEADMSDALKSAERAETITVGAGDSLLAGMLHGLLEGWSGERTLRLATAVAAQAVGQIGFGIGDRQQLARLETEVSVQALEPTPTRGEE